MHTRYMERVNSMRGKRSLEETTENDQQPERKRPALASVIVEALKFDNLQKLFSSMEPILRRVVSEEVERALAKLGPSRMNGRSSPKRIEGRDGRNLQLQFKSKLSLPLFTGGKIEGEQGAAIHVVLVDVDGGQVVTIGPESNIKLDVVVLEGDFNNEDDDDWSQDEFESHVVKEREGKRPLLNGELQVTLKEGVGTLGDVTFTDNSSWIRSRKFRLGLKVSSGVCEGIRIREAKTEAFTVKDHRGELYKKHYPPSLNDEVWRLEKIGKDGSFHKRLTKAGIFTVEDFLRLVVKDSQKLRSILGTGMSNRMWDALIEHANTCALSGRLYVYYPDETRNLGVVFNNIYELNGLITDEQYLTAEALSESQKVYVDNLVKKAYENWSQVIEYDGKSLFGYAHQSKRLDGSRSQFVGQIDYPNSFDNQLSTSSSSILSEQSNLQLDGYNDSLANKYPNSSQFLTSENHNNAFSSQEHIGLALGPPQTTKSNQYAMSSYDWSNNGENGVENHLLEEEIRMGSHEILGNEDMQHLLQHFSMGGGDNSHGNMPDGYGFPSYIPAPTPDLNYCFEDDDDDNARPGKSFAGWLKIKAAMRWGFFIRKKAAERRRAQLVELDDD